ncbi:hypothetical protein C7974DRAFT_113910 [Boeremia exigua]|uniref:uncharacterized protein n=1 Tax=Boeremia exigua TaxID=749465 RepID=UPI001E8EE51A|nr:uncharacterized protein C7974DRAFT_113910 [Boeremia exigua]KAH6642980.1 hypothetical protein C7974DRAFT_113910 [Boeremia exigua]
MEPPAAPSKALLDTIRHARQHPPAAPSKGLLEMIRHAREHPEEVARKLREEAILNGKDPDTMKNWMLKIKNNAPSSSRSHTSKEDQTTALAERGELTIESMDIDDGHEPTIESMDIDEAEHWDRSDTPIHAAPAIRKSPVPQHHTAAPQAIPALHHTKRPEGPPSRMQQRVGSTGQISKSAQRKMRKGGSGRASPLAFSGQSPAESSASGSSMLEDPNSPVTSPSHSLYPFPTRPAMPSWYNNVPKQKALKRRPPEITAIDALKDSIKRTIYGYGPGGRSSLHNELRNHIHGVGLKYDNISDVTMLTSRILTDIGLPRIFDELAALPWDLKADAWVLYERWMNRDFDASILRGITTVKGKDRNGDRLDRAYTEKYPKQPKTFGNNGAVIGQWWPTQLCAVRDGVHGAPQGGIYGDKERGAYSIVLSSGGYHDRDDGDTIEYSGTEGSNFEIKAATQSMVVSSKLRNHIRVLRSSQLPKSNKYRPSCGLRYDGLYQIKSYKILDQEKQIHRFHLERVPGQFPIRFEGDAKRPTMLEEKAYAECKGIH